MFSDKRPVSHARRPSARLIGGALVVLMIFGTALGADASTKKHHKAVVKKTTRTVKLSYTGGCTLDIVAVGASERGQCSSVGAAGWDLPLKAGEKYVSVTVTDHSGRATPGAFWETGGTGGTSKTVPFCGSTKDYTAPAGTVTMALDAVGAIAGCPGLATQGTVTVVFSNLP